MKHFPLFFVVLLILSHHNLLFSQESADSVGNRNTRKTSVFIDCDDCDQDFIKEQIGFVDYVRDRSESDVHILTTTQRSGSGGKEYTLTFIGKNDFVGVNDTLVFNTKKADSEEMKRTAMVRMIKLGLIRYVSKTSAADDISITASSSSTKEETKDQWDYWVFSINTNVFVNGEKSSKSSSMYGSLSANRVTKDMKVNISAGFDYNENSYDYVDYVYESFSRGKNFNGLVVWSLGDHWSAGGSLSMYTSTYDNTQFAISPAPALEYDLFPYSESTRRQLRFLYKIPYTRIQYMDSTIYDKTEDQLWSENLSISLDVKEVWGSAGISVEGSHYFFDYTKYNVGIFGNLSLRIIEGLSLNLFGNYQRIHDQLSLAKEGATEEEVLLRRVALETNYRYFASIGISYTFGSIFNNVVNPRFGSGGGSSFSFSF